MGKYGNTGGSIIVYEYGVAFHDESLDDPHRTGMTLTEAEKWIRGWEEDGGRPGAFYIIRREMQPWHPYSRFMNLNVVPPRGELTKRLTCPYCRGYLDAHTNGCIEPDPGFS